MYKTIFLEDFIIILIAKKILMFWGFRTSGMLHCGAEWIAPENSKKIEAFIFIRVRRSILMDNLALEMEALWYLVKSEIYDDVL